MTSLLTKTRMLNKILQKSGTEPVVFDDICKLLSEVLSCNVYIASRKGKILGYNFSSGFECDIVKNEVIAGKRFPDFYNAKLLNIHETLSNTKSNHGNVFFSRLMNVLFKINLLPSYLLMETAKG